MIHIHAFPFMIVAVAIYAIVVMLTGVRLDAAISFGMPSSGAQVGITTADGIIILGLVCLFVELINSMSARARAILNHALSMGVFILCILLFILVGKFGTGTFLILTLMTLLDVVAGYSISISTARRDIGIDPTQS